MPAIDIATLNSMKNDATLIMIREKYTSVFLVILTAGIGVFAFSKLTNKI